MPCALITGITGQDGSYLSELLLAKQYQVVGLISPKHNIGFDNINHIKDQLTLEEGDLLDQASLSKLIEKHNPNEIYNLGGITFIPASWEKPTLTLDINTLGLSRLLELLSQRYHHIRLFQASSSKIFGSPEDNPQTENTPLNPLDPYSISKASSHRLIQIFRDHFGLYLASGIMYNHESPRRGPEFVTRKITQAAARIKLGLDQNLSLGDLDAAQDWGFAPDYVKAMWLMLQQEQADDYIIASGTTHTVADIASTAFTHLGLNYQDYVVFDERYARKEKQTAHQGDITKASQKLGWQPETSFKDMIIQMVEHDLNLASTSQT